MNFLSAACLKRHQVAIFQLPCRPQPEGGTWGFCKALQTDKPDWSEAPGCVKLGGYVTPASIPLSVPLSLIPSE